MKPKSPNVFKFVLSSSQSQPCCLQSTLLVNSSQDLSSIIVVWPWQGKSQSCSD